MPPSKLAAASAAAADENLSLSLQGRLAIAPPIRESCEMKEEKDPSLAFVKRDVPRRLSPPPLLLLLLSPASPHTCHMGAWTALAQDMQQELCLFLTEVDGFWKRFSDAVGTIQTVEE
jgi:hypothetical protein